VSFLVFSSFIRKFAFQHFKSMCFLFTGAHRRNNDGRCRGVGEGQWRYSMVTDRQAPCTVECQQGKRKGGEVGWAGTD
jgi:hypothetical protein